MARLLLLEIPGGNDFTVLEDAVALGHEVVFVTGDLSAYEAQGEPTRAALALAAEVVEVAPFSYAALEERALAMHVQRPFEAVLCILDIRIVEAARLAKRLGLRFLDPEVARLARDKVGVREALARCGVRQPAFALARDADELRRAVAAIGYPSLVKPADGYGSQNVTMLRVPAELDALSRRLEAMASEPTDYGLGVLANNRFSVERYLEGAMIGCDVFTGVDGRAFLGVNDKRMFPPPSFAFRGSCFPSERHDTMAIRAYAFEVLDAIGFDFGAAHIEMIVSEDEPWLVEVNPRLVSAQIPFQMAYAFGRSVYADLIDLHLGQPVMQLEIAGRVGFSAIRWITAERTGRLQSVELPQADAAIRRVVLFKGEGDLVRPPLSNGDRIGYVIALGETETTAEEAAERYVDGCVLRLQGGDTSFG